MIAFPWPLAERRPATPQATRLGRSAGSGQRQVFRRVLPERRYILSAEGLTARPATPEEDERITAKRLRAKK